MKLKLDKYFLEEACPFTQRRKFKSKPVKIAAISSALVGLLVILVATPSPEKAGSETVRAASIQSQSESQAAPRMNDDPFRGSYSLGSLSSAKSNRQYTASQVVRRGEGNSGDKLPMGSTIPVKLVNSVLSSDSNSPVIAEVLEDVFWKNSLAIPAGTQAIGQGTLDDGTERLQARFNTLVYPEGSQHSISALALLTDGSSGIAGDFHSGEFKKNAGRFAGNFIGGLAQGLKEKDSRGQVGIVFEPGSLKNGLLNGIATSSLDQANAWAQNTERNKPYLEVPGGTTFLMYLEREFSP